MCVMCYVATDREMPDILWEPGKIFCVERDKYPRPEAFTGDWKHVYYCGSHEGCGCGYTASAIPRGLLDASRADMEKDGTLSDAPQQRWWDMPDVPPKSAGDLAKKEEGARLANASVDALFCWLREVAPAEVLICWAGGENELEERIAQPADREALVKAFKRADEEWSASLIYRFEA